MSNEESRNIKDTRGRPRNEIMEAVAEDIEGAYRMDHLPVHFTIHGDDKARRKAAKKLRNARSFVDLQVELGVRLRVLPSEEGYLVCLRKEK